MSLEIITMPMFVSCAQNANGTIVSIDYGNTLYKIDLAEVISSATLIGGGQYFSIDIDSNGYIYITCGDGSIQKYNPDLSFFGYICYPETFPVYTRFLCSISTNDTVYVAVSQYVYRIVNGSPSQVASYDFGNVTSMVFDIYDNIYISTLDAIYKLAAENYSITTLVTGMFNSISVAPSGVVYYCDSDGNVGKINSDSSTTVLIPSSSTFYGTYVLSLITGQIVSTSEIDEKFYIYSEYFPPSPPSPIKTKPISAKAIRAANSFPSNAMRMRAIAGREIIRSLQGGAKKYSASADITTTYDIARSYILARSQL